MSYMFIKVRGRINPVWEGAVKIPEYNCTLKLTDRKPPPSGYLRSKAFDSRYTPDAKPPIEKDFIIIWKAVYEYTVTFDNSGKEYKFYDCAYITSAETHKPNPTKRISVDIDESALRSSGEIKEEKIKEAIARLTDDMQILLNKKEEITHNNPDNSYAIGLCDRDILVCQDEIDKQKTALNSITEADYDINRQFYKLQCKNCLSVTYSVFSQDQIDGLYGCEVYNDNGRLVWGNTFATRDGSLSGVSRWILDAYNLRVKENIHPNMILPYIVRELTEEEKRAYMTVCKYGMLSTGSSVEAEDSRRHPDIYLSNDVMELSDLLRTDGRLTIESLKQLIHPLNVVIDPRREDDFQG